MHYLHFALLTVVCWGTYGVCMHIGSSNMGDKENGRIMAFLWVGLAYFLTAVVAPLIILKLKGGNVAFWTFPAKGWQWSLIAGTLGAIGALGVPVACIWKDAFPCVRTSNYVGDFCWCSNCKRHCKYNEGRELAACKMAFCFRNRNGSNWGLLSNQART